MNRIKKLTYFSPLVAVLAVGGCETLKIDDFNNPGLNEILDSPTRSTIATLGSGVLVGARAGMSGRAGYISELGILGRESYNFDAADPRFVEELLVGPLDRGNGAFGGNHWVARYINLRNEKNLIDAAESGATSGDLSAAEAAGMTGFAKTMMALDLLLVINTRDDFGAVIQFSDNPTGAPAPIASKSEVFAEINRLLDEGNSDLAGAGSSFMSEFKLSSGFAGFDTPAGFAQFNRALKARVAIYQNDYMGALTALGGSFIDGSANSVSDLEVGVYHTFSQGPGDVTNGLFDPSRLVLLAHPSIVADAQPGDERLDRKVIQIDPVSDQTGRQVSTDRAFTIYNSLEAKLPIIRNEELILIRAEANLGLGNVEQARQDINLIRTVSGGLSSIDSTAWAGMTATQREDELLYNRRYSLLWEGHRWIDMRRKGRLNQLPIDHLDFTIPDKFPIPTNECLPRSDTPSGCQ